MQCVAFCSQRSSDHRRPRDCLMSPRLGPAALLDWIIPVLSCGVFSSSSGLLPNRYQELSSRNIANVLCGAALPPHLAGSCHCRRYRESPASSQLGPKHWQAWLATGYHGVSMETFSPRWPVYLTPGTVISSATEARRLITGNIAITQSLDQESLIVVFMFKSCNPTLKINVTGCLNLGMFS